MTEFMNSIDVALTMSILGVGILSWGAGYKAGYSLYITRRITNMST